jgi:hypothetical protein
MAVNKGGSYLSKSENANSIIQKELTGSSYSKWSNMIKQECFSVEDMHGVLVAFHKNFINAIEKIELKGNDRNTEEDNKMTVIAMNEEEDLEY